MVRKLYDSAGLRPDRDTLATAISAEIEQEIIQKGFPAGTVIATEAELLSRFGVSRLVLRQAAVILEAHGVARMRRGNGGGLMVLAPDASSVTRTVALFLEHRGCAGHQIWDVRMLLEPECAALAATNIDDAGRERLLEWLQQEAGFVTDADWRGSIGLHFLVAELSGNPVLQLVIESLARLSLGRRGRNPNSTKHDHGKVARDHRSVVAAIMSGDADRAREAMRAHTHTALSEGTN